MRRIIALTALSAIFLIGTVHAEEPGKGLDLLLRCAGEGTRLDAKTANLSASTSTGQTVTGDATIYSKEHFNDSLLLDLKGDGGRIRMPRSMVPPISGGGADGWWTLSDLQVSENTIQARFKMNFLNKPLVRIDRSSGDIEVSGFAGSNFRGSCEPLDRAQRKF